MQNKLLFALLSLLAGSLALLYAFMYTFACRYSNSLICTPFLVHIEFNRYDQYVLQPRVNTGDGALPSLEPAFDTSRSSQCLPQRRKLEAVKNLTQFGSYGQYYNAQLEAKRLIDSLRAEIDRVKQLKLQNERLTASIDQISSHQSEHAGSAKPVRPRVQLSWTEYDAARKEILKESNYKYRDPEWATIPWLIFSNPDDNIYHLEKGISGGPQVQPGPDQREDIKSAIQEAINDSAIPPGFLANPQPSKIYGLTKSTSHKGSLYHLYYQHDLEVPVFAHATLVRPFAPLHYSVIEVLDKRSVLINVVLPIQYQLDAFVNFLTNFTSLSRPQKERWQLTVAYYGVEAGASEMEEVLKRQASSAHYRDYHFLTLSPNFSHGEAVLAGVASWKKSDILTVVTEVHVVFESSFLERCVKFVTRQSQVYFPNAFALYNPDVVYKRKYKFSPTFNKQLVLNVHKGFWMDQDFSTWAAYKSDILSIPSLRSESPWYNSVIAFRHMAKAGYTVVRAPDRGLYVSWHWRDCNANKEPDGYYAICMNTNARQVGPPHTLGMIVFKIQAKWF